MKKIILFIISLILVLIVVFFALKNITQDSIPGEKMYGVKTGLIEKSISLTKLTQSSKLAYQVKLMENRLGELVVIGRDNGTTTPENISYVTRLINQYANNITETISSGVTNAESLDTIAHTGNILRAAEMVTEASEEFAAEKDVFSDIRSKVGELLDNSIEKFVSESDTATVDEYIAQHIKYVGTKLETVAQNSKAQRQAFARISDTNDAITDKNQSEAISSLLSAERALATDAYLWDSERGPVDGEIIEPGPVPEGS